MGGGADGLVAGRAPLRPGPGRGDARGYGSPLLRRRELGAAVGAPRERRLGRGPARGRPRERAQPQVRLAPDELLPGRRRWREGLGNNRGYRRCRSARLDVPAVAERVLAVGARITERRAVLAAWQLLCLLCARGRYSVGRTQAKRSGLARRGSSRLRRTSQGGVR